MREICITYLEALDPRGLGLGTAKFRRGKKGDTQAREVTEKMRRVIVSKTTSTSASKPLYFIER